MLDSNLAFVLETHLGQIGVYLPEKRLVFRQDFFRIQHGQQARITDENDISLFLLSQCKVPGECGQSEPEGLLVGPADLRGWAAGRAR